MSKTPWWERKGAKLRSRTWHEIRDSWMNYAALMPSSEDIDGVSLSDLESLKAATSQVTGDDPEYITEEIAGLRASVLAEAFFLIHKSINVLGCTQVHVNAGLCSWSLSSAYHSAFFGIKAILQLLGVVVVEVGGRSFLVDIWAHSAGKPSRRQILLGVPSVVLIQATPRIEHRQLWGWFQRMLRVCDVPGNIWPLGCVDALKNHDLAAFASQRNAIHYSSTFWPRKDLHRCEMDAHFAMFPEGLDDGIAISDPSSQNFSLALAFVVCSMAVKMGRDLSQSSEPVRHEIELIEEWLSGSCNDLYRTAIQSASR